MLVSIAFLSQPASAQSASAQSASASPAKIAAAIGRLGDDEFNIREEATTFLWKSGKTAQAALELAAKSDDREVATRAGEILEKVRLGIFPDTPPEVINLVRSFQSG